MQAETMKVGIMMMTFGANRCLTIKTKRKMKKNLFMVAAVALMALVSCNKEEINNGGVEPQEPQAPSVTVEFTASLGEEETKTTLDFENKKTLWEETDAISINGQKFTIKEIQEDGKAVFVNAAELPADFAAPFTAIYPYGSDGKVPAAQDAVAGSFDPKAVIETATSENHSLSFKNETSLLKFQVPAACNSVSVASDDVLAGDSDKVVTISGDFVAGKDYYVAVLPGTKKNFVVRIDGYLSKNAASVTINASTIANMKTLPAAKVSTIELRGDAPLSWDNGAKFYEDIDCYVLKNVSVSANQGFKVVYNNKWLQGKVAKDKWAVLKENGNNMTLAAGTYDIYVSKEAKVLGVVAAGSSSLKVEKPESDYMYLLPSDNWLESNAHFAAWIWKDNGSGKVYNFSEHPNVAGLYRVKLNEGNKMILFRMAPGKTYTDGSSTWPGNDHWYKTGDLSIGSNNLYTVVNWHANGSGFSKVETLL